MTDQPRQATIVRKGNKWSELRVAGGLSIRELETATGISRGVLSMIESGRAPTPEQAAAILAVLRPS